MSIISLHPVRERDHVPSGPDAFAVSPLVPTAAVPCAGCQCAPMTCDGGCGHTCCCPDSYPLPAVASVERLVVVDHQGAPDFASFAARVPGPVVVCVDEFAALYAAIDARRAAAFTQRADLHLDLSDDLLGDLAVRAVYRRPLWRRLVAGFGGVR